MIKKSITNKKMWLFTAALAAVMAVVMAASVATPAKAMENATTPTIKTFSEMTRKEQQQERLRLMQRRTADVFILNHGWYTVKEWKLYGRKAIGVADNGDFILGDWELLHDRKSIWSTDKGTHIEISGDYVAFAFSCDITWGTDFPYSGVFWNEPDYEIYDVTITLSGGCRNVDVDLLVKCWKANDYEMTQGGDEAHNCSSHSEWKP